MRGTLRDKEGVYDDDPLLAEKVHAPPRRPLPKRLPMTTAGATWLN
jgi:hypothetical protein